MPQYAHVSMKENFSSIPTHYEQNFRYMFSAKNVSKKVVIQMRAENQLTKRDVDVAKFLFEHQFATVEQIARSFDGDYPVDQLFHRLNKLVMNRVVNVFTLSDTEMSDTPEDALLVYCLDFGGKYLVNNYSELDAANWSSAEVMMSAAQVVKGLMTTDFYLELREALGDRLLYFRKNPQYVVQSKKVTMGFEFSFANEFQKGYMIGDVTHAQEQTINIRDRYMMLNEFLLTQHWYSYFVDSDKPPTLLILTDSDQVALEMGLVMQRMTKIESYLFTTSERIRKTLGEKGVFLQYKPEDNILKTVRLQLFAPQQKK